MNRQEILDRVVPLILKNGFSFFRGVCCYRKNHKADDEVRCAIGYLIPDDKYTTDIEGRRAASFAVGSLLKDIGLDFDSLGPKNDLHFIEDLQDAHDNAVLLEKAENSMERFLSYIKTLCSKFDLEYRSDWKFNEN